MNEEELKQIERIRDTDYSDAQPDINFLLDMLDATQEAIELINEHIAEITKGE